jgi:hypothetical protein
MFFIRRVGDRGPGLTYRPKKARFSRGCFPAIRGDFPPRFAGISPRDLRGFPPAICRGLFIEIFPLKIQVKNSKCAHCFLAPEPMSLVCTATPVLHEVQTRCLIPCVGRHPVESKVHFWTQCSAVRRCEVEQWLTQATAWTASSS